MSNHAPGETASGVLDRESEAVVAQGHKAMTSLPIRAMPVRWALVFAAVVGLACAGGTWVLRDLLQIERPERVWVDTAIVPASVSGRQDAYSIRWLESGLPRLVQVEGDEARERVERWVRR